VTSPIGGLAAAPQRRPWVLLLIAVCLIAGNLRMTITGVGPLLEEIAEDRGVAVATLGALASLTLITWGVFSPFAHGLSSRFGMTRTVSGALAVLLIATIWRSMPGWSANLWIGTALTGFGLAIGNALMPAVIKRDFGSRVPLVMGLYTALLGALGAASSGLVVPISQFTIAGETLGWQVALLASGALLPITLVIWVVANYGRSRQERLSVRVASNEDARADAPQPSSHPGRRIWGDPLAWLVSLYMGSQSTIFYMISTWLAPYLTSLDVSPVAAGVYLMFYQLFGILGSILLPVLARGRAMRWSPVLIPALAIVAYAGLLVAPAAVWLWLLLGGLGVGASLTAALTLMATRARTLDHSSALSGMAQSVGYLIAAVGPTVFGWLHGWHGGWLAPFALVWATALIQLVLGVLVGREGYVLEPRAPRRRP